ncbi:MAG: hypothetical protein Q7S42_03610 [Candidatus Omnitrophota bacterium]|nr:hypothetical protein [Candidatus Omnitrophota bacterium]
MALKKKNKTKKTLKKTTKKRIIKKKTVKRKPALKKKKPAPKKKPTVKKTVKKEGKLVGLITHYFPHVQAAVIKLKAPLTIGDSVKIKGHTTDFTQPVTSIQIDRISIQSAKKGDEIGMQVISRARQQDKVYRV